MTRALAVLFLLISTVSAGSAGGTYALTADASEETRAAIASGRSPDHGFPAIVRVNWTSNTVHPGTTIAADVSTSPNVTHVEGRYRAWGFPFERVGTGRFRISYQVPWLPPFLIGDWSIDVVARTDDGVEVTRSYLLRYSY